MRHRLLAGADAHQVRDGDVGQHRRGAQLVGGEWLRHDADVRGLPQLLDDEPGREKAKRVILCSGKVYYDLVAEREARAASDTAIVRVEQIYPLHAARLREVLQKYKGAKRIVWCQEEPQNMGAWSFIDPCIRGNTGRPVTYIGRPRRASPAEGYADVHEKEQKRLTTEAIRVTAPKKAGRSSR